MIPINIRILMSVTCCSLVIAGCQTESTDPRPVFSEVQKDIARRSGLLVHWHTESDEDAAVQARVSKMLEDKLDGDEAVQIALLNNPRLQGTYERLGIAQAQLVQAGLLKNPIFDLSLRYFDGPSSNYVLEMGVVQDFLDVLMVPLRKNVARAELERTKAEVKGQVMEIAARVKIAVISLDTQTQSLQLNQQIYQAAAASYEAARRLHAAGNITSLALAMERSMYEQAKLEVSTVELSVQESREQLNVLMGLWGTGTVWMIQAHTADPQMPDLETEHLESEVITNSLDLLIAREQMKATAARLGIEKWEVVFPEMAAGAETEREPGNEWSTGPVIEIGIPVFDMGQAKEAAAEAQMRRLWDEYTALSVEIRSAARALYYRLQNTGRQHEYYRRVIVPLAEQITAETQLQYNAMQVGVFHLLSAKQREFSARRRAVEMTGAYQTALAEMELLLAGTRLQTALPQSPSASNMGFSMDSGGGH